MRYVDAILCAAAVLLLDWLWVGLVHGGELAGAFEWGHALLTLLPLSLLLIVPAAVGGALMLHGVLEPVERRGRVLVTAPIALLALTTSIGVSTGRRLAALPLRVLFILAATMVIATGAWFGAGLLRRVHRRFAHHTRRWALGITLMVLGLGLVNRLVLPRLYPAFHAGLALATVWTGCLAAAAWSREGRGARLRLMLLAATLLGGGALAVRAPGALRYFDNLRFVFHDRSPLLRYAVLLSSSLSPPPPIAVAAEDGARDQAFSLDWRGRSVLLVSIDAVRADHVGAYGYARDTTPHFDRLATTGAVFEAAYTPAPHTSYAIGSLMTGRHLRPLFRQEAGADAEPMAATLRHYDFATAAFYPPAVFFIDGEKFAHLRESGLGFTYRKEQFSSASARVKELEHYFATEDPSRAPLFAWVHLFEPHEPYEGEFEDWGSADIDRYDAEIRTADRALGALVDRFRARFPTGVVIVTADHGEEFGDHGGRYHGTTVYEEQVRVPLVIDAPGSVSPVRIASPVSLVDLAPTIFRANRIPVSPRLRGRDLGAEIAGVHAPGFAFAESDEQTLIAEGRLRLVCAQPIAACRLFDIETDPRQKVDVAGVHAAAFERLKSRSDVFMASLGRFDREANSHRFPRALRRGIAGERDAATDVAALLDDVDVLIRRQAAKTLYELRVEETSAQLERALQGDEDDQVRRWAALGLSRLGHGAALVFDMVLEKGDRGPPGGPSWQRLAALVLAEGGDGRGRRVLLRWLGRAFPKKEGEAREELPFEQGRSLVRALGRVGEEEAVIVLSRALRDLRLRPHAAAALAELGEEAGRPALADALAAERYPATRVALVKALVKLGGKHELRLPLIRFLGVREPLPEGLRYADQMDLIAFVGGPRDRELRRLREFATTGVVVGALVPKSDHRSNEGFRVLVRARAPGGPGEVRVALAGHPMGDGDRRQRVPKARQELDPSTTATVIVPESSAYADHHATFPAAAAGRLEAGEYADFLVYATQSVELESFVVVPLADEVAPPPPEPWSPREG